MFNMVFKNWYGILGLVKWTELLYLLHQIEIYQNDLVHSDLSIIIIQTNEVIVSAIKAKTGGRLGVAEIAVL